MKSNKLPLFLLALTSVAHADGHFLPEGAYNRVVQAASSGTPSESLKKIQNIICNGKKSKFYVKHSFVYVAPKTAGMGLDEAAKLKKTFLDSVRVYAKEGLFFETSGKYLGAGELDNSLEFRRYAPVAEDMRLLMNGFTFKLPEEGLDPEKSHYFGYDSSTHQFSASKAVEERDFIWKHVLKNSTKVMEAPNNDGSIKFSLELSFDSFCSYGIPVTDLISN